MTREEIIKSMSLQDAIQVLKDTNTYGTADIAKSVILKALEQEPNKSEIPTGSTDCISRAAVIDSLYDWSNHSMTDAETWHLRQVIGDIKSMPSVTPREPRWIPVSEKLPNDRNWYLGIFKEPDTGWINPLPFICDYVGRETKATTKEYWILHGFTDMDEHIDYYFNLECVAWMPFPTGYEPQESEPKDGGNELTELTNPFGDSRFGG